MPFPLVKLVYLFVKQVSKPVATRITTKLKTMTFTRNNILIPAAQWYHRVDTNIKMNLLKLGKPKKVDPLSEGAAVDLASEMLNDFLIFSIAAGVLFLEYRRGQISSSLEKARHEEELQELENKIISIRMITEEQDAKLREMQREMYDLHSKNISLTSRLKDTFVGQRPKTVEAGKLKVVVHPDVGDNDERSK